MAARTATQSNPEAVGKLAVSLAKAISQLPRGDRDDVEMLVALEVMQDAIDRALPAVRIDPMQRKVAR